MAAMPDFRQLAPFPPEAPRSPAARGRRLSPLARDIIIVLIVKAVVLYLLWFAFFRMPAAPGMTMDTLVVEQRVFAPAPDAKPAHER
jgi:hypothetical protein